MPDTVIITNDGPAILTTTFWQTDAARAGKFYLSINAGTFRLLVPQANLGALRDMRQAHTAVVSRGPWPAQGLPDAVELLFDDGSADPWALHLSVESCDRLHLDTDSTQTWTLTVWTHRVGLTATCALTLPCHYRRVRRLPDLRPWQA